MNEHGIKYLNLFEFINAKARENKLGNDINEVGEREFRDTLDMLEEEGVINLIGHSKAPTIRFVQ